MIDLTSVALWRTCAIVLAAVSSIAAMPPISEQARATIDRTMGVKGVYVSEESAHKFVFPRNDVSLRVGGQRLSPAQAPRSWATFSPSMHREGMMNGELILLDDEVNPVITVALRSGLEITGLGATLLSEQPRLLTLNVTAEGSFQELARALRTTLDGVSRVRAERRDLSGAAESSTQPVSNTIDPSPLNTILSMRGSAPDGIYRASIGRIALVNDTPIGREMGMRTAVSIFGTNEHAFAEADVIVTHDELQRVLVAIRAKNLNITSIRNHLVGEHPQYIFIRLWGRGTAADLATGLRYVLDIEVGAVRPPARQ